jgi:hypothetical protein
MLQAPSEWMESTVGKSAMKSGEEWKVYRTRFLVRARQLTEDLTILDTSGREQMGRAGDYLVECSDGSRRIAPRHIFEDIYVEIETPVEPRMFSLVRDARRVHQPVDDPRQAPLFSRTG